MEKLKEFRNYLQMIFESVSQQAHIFTYGRNYVKEIYQECLDTFCGQGQVEPVLRNVCMLINFNCIGLYTSLFIHKS